MVNTERIITMADNLIFSIFPNDNFIDLRLYQSGMEKCVPAHSFGPAARNNYLFHYIMKGSGTLMADDSKGITRRYELKKGQGFLLFPDQIATYIASRDDPWEYMWIEFGGLRVKEALINTELSLDNCIYQSIYPEIREKMIKEIEYIVYHPQDSTMGLIGHLYLFFDALIRSCSLPVSSSNRKMSDYYIKEAIHYVEQNFANDISVESIAEILGINRTYFGKIFKKSTGKSPQQFIIEYRMTKACSLLQQTNMTVTEISRQIGYENPFHFSRAFKQIYNVSPSKWRNEHQFPIPLWNSNES